MKEYTINGRHVTCWQGNGDIIAYANVFAEQREELAALMTLDKLTLVTIDSVDWNGDFSPWPAKRVFAKEADFAGNGTAYIKEMTTAIIPVIEQDVGIPRERIIAGYSLAGLLAYYALYETPLFTRAVCASPSLWYDGMSDFVRTHSFAVKPKSIYFSLGNTEKKTRNMRMKTVEDAIVETEKYVSSQGITTTFILNPGNHFQQPMKRLAQGIEWTIEQIEKEMT